MQERKTPVYKTKSTFKKVWKILVIYYFTTFKGMIEPLRKVLAK